MLDIIIFAAYIGLVLVTAACAGCASQTFLFVAPLAALTVMIPAAVFSEKK